MPANKANLKKEGLRIGLVGLPSYVENGGTAHYVCSLFESLIKFTKYGHNIFILKDKDDSQVFKDNRKTIKINLNSSGILQKILKFLYIEAKPLRNILDAGGFYGKAKNCVNLTIAPYTSLTPIYIGSPYIITVHDLQHKYYPRFFGLRERLDRNFVYKNAAKNALFVVCESRFVKKDIIRFLNIAPEKIRVIPSPPPSHLIKLDLQNGDLEKVKIKYGLENKFLFYPAHFWYHKNHINLIRAVDLIKKRHGKNVPLVFVGLKKNNFENAQKVIKQLGLEEQVKYLGYIPDEELPYLYKLAEALIMPSLFESLSLPIWEAFSLGVPVISSNVCALGEQVNDAGLLFDPNDPEDMAKRIYSVMFDDSLRKKLIQKGYEVVKNTTLENYAKQWETVIAEALEKSLVFEKGGWLNAPPE